MNLRVGRSTALTPSLTFADQTISVRDQCRTLQAVTLVTGGWAHSVVAALSRAERGAMQIV
jgi:hypothetical protein